VVLEDSIVKLSETVSPSIENELKRLNQSYVDAFMHGDSKWYQENLAEDFVCVESDGSVVPRTKFLQQAAKGPDVVEYRLEEVTIRVFGEAALVRATGRFTRGNGTTGRSRYVDVYRRIGEEWKVVYAQVTRTSSRRENQAKREKD
jgi:ketosteroid isomerase-like protein